jgi:hypothetical protein
MPAGSRTDRARQAEQQRRHFLAVPGEHRRAAMEQVYWQQSQAATAMAAAAAAAEALATAMAAAVHLENSVAHNVACAHFKGGGLLSRLAALQELRAQQAQQGSGGGASGPCPILCNCAAHHIGAQHTARHPVRQQHRRALLLPGCEQQRQQAAASGCNQQRLPATAAPTSPSSLKHFQLRVTMSPSTARRGALPSAVAGVPAAASGQAVQSRKQ